MPGPAYQPLSGRANRICRAGFKELACIAHQQRVGGGGASMNKVNVNVAGSQDMLFVVRDLNSMVNLQKLMYTKKHFNYFTEKIVRQIQESSEVSLINLQKLDNHLDEQGRQISDETLNETKRILHRILDFEQVYNISEGTFSQAATNFKVSDIFE